MFKCIIKIKYNQDSDITISKSEDRNREIIDIQIILRDSYVNFIIMYFRTLHKSAKDCACDSSEINAIVMRECENARILDISRQSSRFLIAATQQWQSLLKPALFLPSTLLRND